MPPNNPLNCWGNEKTMNLNTLILTNIQASPYFKVQLFELKTFHEVVDEIYYKVEHLEPWEKGSRKTAGQTGMCGGVRGVGAGGIVSSAYCLLYKLFTLKLTKKQLNNLINHADSPYIRGLGFMYIRYTQNPQDLWDWYEDYLDDEEELDVKAGTGHTMSIGDMLRQWLVKLEWYSTLFPRIPVPIQKEIDIKMRSRPVQAFNGGHNVQDEPEHIPDDEVTFGEAERAFRGGASGGRREDFYNRSNGQNRSRHSPPSRRSPPHSRRSPPHSRRSPPSRHRSRSPRHSPYSRDRDRGDDFSRELERERNRQRKERERDEPRDRDRKGDSKHKHRDDHRDRERDEYRERERDDYRERERDDRERDRDDYRNGKSDKQKSKDKDHRRSRSPEKKKKKSHDHERKRSVSPVSREKHKEHKKKHKHKDKHRDRD